MNDIEFIDEDYASIFLYEGAGIGFEDEKEITPDEIQEVTYRTYYQDFDNDDDNVDLDMDTSGGGIKEDLNDIDILIVKLDENIENIDISYDALIIPISNQSFSNIKNLIRQINL